MTAEAKVTIFVEVDALGSKKYELPIKFIHGTTPEEVFHGYAVIGSTACNLNLGTVDGQEVSGVLIIAQGTADTDYVGILVDDDGTGTPSTAAGNITINAGEAVYLNFGGSTGGLTDGQYIRLKGAASTTAIEYLVFGSHS